jgi:hypothetical protein
MSKVKYVIMNGENSFLVYEHEKLGYVVVVDHPLDINAGPNVMQRSDDGNWSKNSASVDLIEFFLSILPRE